MKKSYWKYLLLVFVILFLFRGPLFRWCVRYECAAEQDIFRLQDPMLLAQLTEEIAPITNEDSWYWAEFAQSFTARHLRFVVSPESSVPDRVWKTGEAHCVGYTALMAAVLVEIYRQKQTELSATTEIKHCRGNIYLFGWRLTGPDRPAFFRDHDFVCAGSVAPSQTKGYDPAVYDYLWICRVQ